MSTSTITCDNCGASIGKIETPFVHQDHVLCVTCYQRVVAARALSGTQGPPATSTAATGQRVCPHCHCPGVTKVRGLQGAGEVMMFLVLFLAFMIPAIIYYIAIEAQPYCPNCGRRVK